MEKRIEELKYQIPFKETTEAEDIVVMLNEETDGHISLTYARVMGFTIDQTKRDEWWHVHFVFLSVPQVARTIILQTPHFTGREVFTMGGRKVFIKAINFGAYDFEQSEPDAPKKESPGGDSPQGRAGRKPTFTLIK